MAGLLPYNEFGALRTALERVVHRAGPFAGTTFRACDSAYANVADLLSGEGSRRYGGRWNAPSGFSTVYLATTLEGAIAETLGVAARYGFDPASRLPLTFVAVNAVLSHVIDLTDPRVRRTLGVTMTAMNACNWKAANAAGGEALTQALGRAAFALSAEAIIVPSALRRGLRNLNVFPDHLRPRSHLRIVHADRLPKPPPK